MATSDLDVIARHSIDPVLRHWLHLVLALCQQRFIAVRLDILATAVKLSRGEALQVLHQWWSFQARTSLLTRRRGMAIT